MDEMPCSDCGELIPPGLRFCDRCGAPVVAPDATAPVAPVAATAPVTAAQPVVPDPPAATARRSLSQGRVAIAGLAGAAMIAAVAFGGWWLATRDAPTAAPAPAASTATPAPSATADAAANAEPAAFVPNREFKSQSGNLRCSVGMFSGEPGAICQQLNINYAVPAAACAADSPGVFVGVGPEGAYWPCVAWWPEPAEVIAYDTPVEQSGVTCTINLETGVRCSNEDGKGFTMEYDAGIGTF